MGITCYCEKYCPDVNAYNGTCGGDEKTFCYSAVELIYDVHEKKYHEYRTYGCLDPDERGLMQCRTFLTEFVRPKNISCCREYDLCNQDLLPQLNLNEDLIISNDTLEINYAYLIATSILFFLIVLAFVLFILFKTKIRNFLKQFKKPEYKHGDLLDDFRSDSMEQSSGSGSGVARLVQSTIGKQIQMIQSIGKGRYGEVLLGKWREEYVAVKVFSTVDEASWLREKEIYQTVLLKHKNILGFVAADIRGMSYTQMLLITDYHELGSLFDYLKFHSIDMESMFVMCHSIANGLSHLHTEIFGNTSGKPAIAHRDIKSKNILVKNDGECCIADFGLAVKYSSEKREIDVGNNPKVGTRRYMAPEVLDGRINLTWFETLKQADIYSLSLVLWEVCRRCEVSSSGEKQKEALEYQLPYSESVSCDPSVEDMMDVVCLKQIRPPILEQWKQDPILTEVSQILKECWQSNPSARLTALRVKYTINKIWKSWTSTHYIKLDV